MSESEEIMARLRAHIERRKADLQQTLEEYERFKALASVVKREGPPAFG